MTTDITVIVQAGTLAPVMQTFRKAADGTAARIHPAPLDPGQFASSLNDRRVLAANRFTDSKATPSATFLGSNDTDAWPAWLLDDATSEHVTAVDVVPGWWRRFKIDLVVANATAGAGNIKLQVQRAYHWHAEALSGATNRSNTAGVVVSALGQWVVQTVEMPDVVAEHSSVIVPASTPANQLVDPIWRFRVTRLGADVADTKPGDLAFLGMVLTRLG